MRRDEKHSYPPTLINTSLGCVVTACAVISSIHSRYPWVQKFSGLIHTRPFQVATKVSAASWSLRIGARTGGYALVSRRPSPPHSHEAFSGSGEGFGGEMLSRNQRTNRRICARFSPPFFRRIHTTLFQVAAKVSAAESSSLRIGVLSWRICARFSPPSLPDSHKAFPGSRGGFRRRPVVLSE